MIKSSDLTRVLDLLEKHDLHLHEKDEIGLEYLKDKPIAMVEFATHYILKGKEIIWYGRTEHLVNWLERYDFNQNGIKQFLDSREPYVDEE